ncbi:MAG: CoA-binding protein [Chloroflexi bacterium]|nr:CoA-binding protein [Chloroflexota bacterium]
MTARSAADDFLSQRSLAVVGASRSGKKFGNIVYRNLRSKGYEVFPVNPNTDELEGDRCYPDLHSLPVQVGGVVVVVPPKETEKVIREAAAAGIHRVWMQQGAEYEEAIRYCEENGIVEVHGECVMMFSGAFPHSAHRSV